MEITIFGVGFGDCIYVTLASGLNVLIDTGHKGQFRKVLKELDNAKKTIDYIFLTHAHSDHMAGINELVITRSGLKGIFYWVPNDAVHAGSVGSALAKLREISLKGCMVMCINNRNKGIIERIFDSELELIYPLNFSTSSYDSKDKNSNSLVLCANDGKKKYLFMGDATEENEKEILSLIAANQVSSLDNVEFWKVGHHCSKTSSHSDFIEHVVGDETELIAVSCKASYDGVNSSKPPCHDKVSEIENAISSLKAELKFTTDSGVKVDIKYP